MRYDKWHSQGPLCKVMSRRARYKDGTPDNVNVRDMIEDGNWKWPANWNKRFPLISNIHVPILQENVHGQHKQFSTNMVWWDLLPEYDAAKWCMIVWFSQYTPKQAFYSMCDFSKEVWVNMKNKCDLETALNNWKIVVESLCNLQCSNSIGGILRRVVFAATIYYIWCERNARIFQQKKMSCESTCKVISEHIRLKLMSFKVKKTIVVMKVADKCNV
ncbi:hypothetical protein Tco_1475825 [Tanacetum coccineum]